jgi:hypothetical protein
VRPPAAPKHYLKSLYPRKNFYMNRTTYATGNQATHTGPQCQDCGRQWTGHAEAHCAGCHHHFTSDEGFDLHLAPPNSADDCYPPAGLKRKNGSPLLETVERKHGPAWRRARPSRNSVFPTGGQYQEAR